MQKSLLLDESGLHRKLETDVGDPQIVTLSKSVPDALVALAKMSYLNTGLLPVDGTGVLSIRSAMGYTQVVFQVAPGAHYVIWGDYEGARQAKSYLLAQPYRILVLDYSPNNGFIGARHFYSLNSITQLDELLYHVNLPNTNCKGYGGGNGVGWTCLYGHQVPANFKTLGEKIHWGVLRMSGDEAYNDANMSRTDGVRFYAEHNKPKYMTDREAWHAKTAADGWQWVMDPDLLVPVKVTGIDDQKAHNNDGVNYTLEMAMYGDYRATYGDSAVPRSFNVIDRADKTFTQDQLSSLMGELYGLSGGEVAGLSADDITKRATKLTAPSGADADAAALFAKRSAAAKKAAATRKANALRKKASADAKAKSQTQHAAVAAATN